MTDAATAVQSGRVKISTVLCPPNPIELDIAAPILAGREMFGITSRAMPGSSLSWLRVGGSVPVRSASMAMTASSAPAAPRVCPVAA